MNDLEQALRILRGSKQYNFNGTVLVAMPAVLPFSIMRLQVRYSIQFTPFLKKHRYHQ